MLYLEVNAMAVANGCRYFLEGGLEQRGSH